jgi:TatD DNase family protein
VVDTHCHLDHCEPPDSELVARAREAGLARLATVGMDSSSIDRALAAADEHAEVFAIVGRHPHESAGFGAEDLDEIERAAAHPKARVIGETGLDYYRDYAPRADQWRALEAQLGLAGQLGMPVAIHTRAAEDDTFALLREHAGDLPAVILHCFSAPDRLEECVERGYLCSFAGNVTYPKAAELQRAATEVPAELLLVETDAPFLSPQVLRSKRNEPAFVVHTAHHVAGLRGMSYDELEQTVEGNAARVFGW